MAEVSKNSSKADRCCLCVALIFAEKTNSFREIRIVFPSLLHEKTNDKYCPVKAVDGYRSCLINIDFLF